MIVPIVKSIKGEDKQIGTASVKPDGDDVAVEYFLQPGYAMADAVMTELTKQLKKLVRR